MIGGAGAYRRDVLNLLCPAQFHEYSSNIRPTRGTGRWIEKKQKFQAWRGRISCKLWIHGKPAAGKSYLAKHITNQLRASGDSLVVDCFLNARLKERNSCEAILRATMHQIATKDSKLWAWAVDRPEVRQPGDGATDWTVEQLSNLWPDLVAKAATDCKGGVSIVLDGFDEVAEEDQNDFLDCLQRCETKLRSQARQKLRVLVLSRWCSSLKNEKRGFIEYEIGEQDNAKDIHRTVQRGLDYFAHQAEYSDDFQKHLCDAVTRGAQGIYLWATVMIADIGIRMPDEQQLGQQLKNLPKDLAELYDSILGNINSVRGDSGPRTQRVLLWVVFGLEPLELHQLNHALTLAELWAKDHERVITQELIQSSMIRPPKVFKATLYRLCGQLLSLSATNHVQPIHSTLTEYLTTHPDVFKDRDHRKWIVPNHETFHLSEQDVHSDLGRMCAAYLMMPPFASAGERFTATPKGRARWELKVQTRVENHPLVKYAALCWLKHAALAGPVQPTPKEEIRDVKNQKTLRNLSTGYGTSWYEVWWFARRWRDFNFPGLVEDFETVRADAERMDNALVPPVELPLAPDWHSQDVSVTPAASVATLVGATNGESSGSNPPSAEGPLVNVADNTTANGGNYYGYVRAGGPSSSETLDGEVVLTGADTALPVCLVEPIPRTTTELTKVTRVTTRPRLLAAGTPK